MLLLALSTHTRNAVRHALALVLMLGTLAGTVWTFSAGALSLSGAWERLVSVGGIAAALECGAIYTAWYIGQLDLRIQTARRREDATYWRTYQASLYRWFYAVAAISAVANLLFRRQQLHNLPLAAFVSLSPIVLVILFCIKLRPLPEDYEEMGRQATRRGLVRVVREAEHTMMRSFKRMGRGGVMTDADTRNFLLAVQLVSVYAGNQERQALDYVVTQHAALPAPSGVSVTPTDDVHYLSTGDLVTLYGVSMRTAQLWASQCPGRRRAANNHAWEAPQSAIEAAHGAPALTLVGAATPGTARNRTRNQPQSSAGQPPTDAGGPLPPAFETPQSEGEAPQTVTSYASEG